jgi:hypothetical protein
MVEQGRNEYLKMLCWHLPGRREKNHEEYKAE